MSKQWPQIIGPESAVFLCTYDALQSIRLGWYSRIRNTYRMPQEYIDYSLGSHEWTIDYCSFDMAEFHSWDGLVDFAVSLLWYKYIEKQLYPNVRTDELGLLIYQEYNRITDLHAVQTGGSSVIELGIILLTKCLYLTYNSDFLFKVVQLFAMAKSPISFPVLSPEDLLESGVKFDFFKFFDNIKNHNNYIEIINSQKKNIQHQDLIYFLTQLGYSSRDIRYVVSDLSFEPYSSGKPSLIDLLNDFEKKDRHDTDCRIKSQYLWTNLKRSISTAHKSGDIECTGCWLVEHTDYYYNGLRIFRCKKHGMKYPIPSVKPPQPSAPPPLPPVVPDVPDVPDVPVASGEECGICLNSKKDTAFVPCGHKSCQTCAHFLVLCHLCRTKIEMKLRLYD